MYAQAPARVAGMDDPRTVLTSEGQLKAVAEGPGGATVLRSDSPFIGRIDLNKDGIEPRRYDLLKLEVKADARAMLQVSLENYPEPGQLSHWYVFAKSRGAFDWETVYVDLHRPEEIMPAGAYKGLEKDADPKLRGLRLAGFVAETEARDAAAGPADLAGAGPLHQEGRGPGLGPAAGAVHLGEGPGPGLPLSAHGDQSARPRGDRSAGAGAAPGRAGHRQAGADAGDAEAG